MNNEPNNTHIPYVGMDAGMSLGQHTMVMWHGMAWNYMGMVCHGYVYGIV